MALLTKCPLYWNFYFLCLNGCFVQPTHGFNPNNFISTCGCTCICRSTFFWLVPKHIGSELDFSLTLAEHILVVSSLVAPRFKFSQLMKKLNRNWFTKRWLDSDERDWRYWFGLPNWLKQHCYLEGVELTVVTDWNVHWTVMCPLGWNHTVMNCNTVTVGTASTDHWTVARNLSTGLVVTLLLDWLSYQTLTTTS